MGNGRRWKRAGALAAALLLAGAAALAWRQGQPAHQRPPAFVLRLALPAQLSAGAVSVAAQQQLFAQQGLAVTQQRFVMGKQALQTVIDGGADVAIVADTPFMLAVLKGERIAALATVYASRKAIAIVGQRASGVHDAASLQGKRIGTTFGTNAEFFLDTMLDVHGVERTGVQFVNMAPEHLVAALREGRIDALTAWQPDLARLEQQHGAGVATVYGDDLFVYRFLLVARRDYIDAHGAELRQLLLALGRSNEFIRNNPEQVRALLASELGLAPQLLRQAFDPSDFTLVLDQSLLLALSAQMRWATAKGLVKPGDVPSYREFVRAEPLNGVAPDANRMIH